MVQRKDVSRRQFLKTAAGIAAGAVAFPYIVSSSVFGAEGKVAPSNRIVMGCIGVGGQGTGNMQGFLGKNEVQVVAGPVAFIGTDPGLLMLKHADAVLAGVVVPEDNLQRPLFDDQGIGKTKSCR